MLGLTVKSAVVYVGIVILVASIAMLAVSTYFMTKIKKIVKNERNHSQLGISLQQVREKQQKGSIAL